MLLPTSLIFLFALLRAKCHSFDENSLDLFEAESPFENDELPSLDLSENELTFGNEEPLLLTPFLTASSANTAQNKASVKSFAGNLNSYSGFFTINETHNSNLFFWFFESEKKPKTDPLILWLHGGPGYSSLLALFGENGPYRVEEGNVILANNSWTKKHNVLYIENPVGTGYSFTDKSAGYPKTTKEAAEHLYEALIQFFGMFPDYKKNEFYLAGQSYAGKYIPKLARIIYEKNNEKKTVIKINLKGLFIGAGFIDPENQLHFSEYFYEHGIFDTEEKNEVQKFENEAKISIKRQEYKKAQSFLNKIKTKLIKCGYKQPFIDVLKPRYNLNDFNEASKFLQKQSTRKELHVGSKKFQDKRQVCWHSKPDNLDSVSSDLSEVVKYYKVLLYSGQFDMVIPPVQVENAIASLSWVGAKAFSTVATYERWYVDGQLAGFMKVYKNLIQVMIRRANHLIIASQPKWMENLISWFTSLN